MRAFAGALGGLILLAATAAQGKATVIIFNANSPDAGFNDSTPVTPVGGNPGTTLGAQRLAVFQAAAEIWGNALDSTVQITVFATFEPLTCDSSGAVLADTFSPNIFASDDPTLDGGVPPTAFPRQHTWYAAAMSERFAGKALLSGTGTDPNNYDIKTRFNSTLDDPSATNCGGLRFYYGLDDQHGNNLDLLTVVLHELGHGLGFSSLTDPSNGAFPLNEPDIWSNFLFDDATGKHWVELDAAGRAASATSGALSWDGAAVTTAIPNTLLYPPLVRVTSAPATPSVVKDYPQVTVAQFSGPIGTSALAGPLGVGSTRWGCTALGRLAPLDGHIAILDRGGPSPDAGCTFVEKARNAQDAGAIGLLIANNTTGLLVPGGTAPDVIIPVLLMIQTNGQALKDAVDAGTVSAEIVRDRSQGFAGADSSGRALLFAPAALTGGSSVSHWDISAFPNLLMEPFINSDLTHSLDLTVPLLRDIGWYSVDVGIAGSGPSTLTGGQQGAFTFTVTNPGPSKASAVTVNNALDGLTFVSNSGACTTAYPCALGDIRAGESRIITTTLSANSDAGAATTASLTSESNYNATNDSVTLSVNGGIVTPDAGTGGGGGKSGCTAALGPPAPWLALLALVAFARRRRRG